MIEAGNKVLVRLTDGTEWMGTVRPAREVPPVSWWRRFFGPPVIEERTMIELEDVLDLESSQTLDGTVFMSLRHVLTVQVVG